MQTQLVSRQHVVELRNVWQEWDAVHIARVRLANRKRDPASYVSKTNTKSTLFLVNFDFRVVDTAKCVAGMGRGAHRARTSGQP